MCFNVCDLLKRSRLPDNKIGVIKNLVNECFIKCGENDE